MFGDIIKKCREKENLSREELADKIGTVTQSIYNYEKDKRCSIDMLIKLTEFLDFEIIIKNGKVFLKEENIIMEITKKDMLSLKEIKSVVKSMLSNRAKLTDKDVDYIFDEMLNNNSVKVIRNNTNMAFESGIYTLEDKNWILIEFRIFDDTNNSMIDAYLEIVDRNTLKPISECIDDVWVYDWKSIK